MLTSLAAAVPRRRNRLREPLYNVLRWQESGRAGDLEVHRGREAKFYRDEFQSGTDLWAAEAGCQEYGQAELQHEPYLEYTEWEGEVDA